MKLRRQAKPNGFEVFHRWRSGWHWRCWLSGQVTAETKWGYSRKSDCVRGVVAFQRRIMRASGLPYSFQRTVIDVYGPGNVLLHDGDSGNKGEQARGGR